MKILEINNKEIFYLVSENQLFEKGLRQVEILSIFEAIWDSYAEKAINLLFESAVENLTCAMLLGEEKAILPLAQLYSKGTIYGILPDLVFSDYIILLGRKLEYEICNDIPLQLITNTKYFDKQLEDLAIIITSNTLFYYSNFRCIGEDIKKKSLGIVISSLKKNGIFVNLNILI
ncbi:MAG: hypothetical protein ACRYE8_03065 [Janthinobacterium lividum]